MIAGNHVELRALDRAHLERTRQWANDPELCRLLDRAFPISDGEHEEWFTRLLERRDRVYFAIEVKPEHGHIGNVWLWDIDTRHQKAEVRIVIGEGVAGKGLGSESIELACRYAFERLNLHRLYAYVLA